MSVLYILGAPGGWQCVPEKEKEIARSGRVLTHDTDRTEGR